MSIIASFLSVLFFDFLFVPPLYSLKISDAEYLITFAVMFIVGCTIAYLTGQLRRKTIAMRLREKRTDILYALSRDLAKSSYSDELFKIALKHIIDFFKCRAVIFVPDTKKNLVARFGEEKELTFSPNEFAVAQWAFENKRSAGKDTDTLPGSSGIYLPFVGAEKTVGVIGVFPVEDKQFEDPEQFHMLEMFVSQTALAVEGAQLAASAIDAEAKIENERFRNMLLSTFSLDLPEPLRAISQSALELLNPDNADNKQKRDELAQRIKKEAGHLNDLSAQMKEIIESKE